MTQIDDRLDDDPGAFVLCDISNEAAIDLDHVER